MTLVRTYKRWQRSVRRTREIRRLRDESIWYLGEWLYWRQMFLDRPWWSKDVSDFLPW